MRLFYRLRPLQGQLSTEIMTSEAGAGGGRNSPFVPSGTCPSKRALVFRIGGSIRRFNQRGYQDFPNPTVDP
jgi:hypothetical protein